MTKGTPAAKQAYVNGLREATFDLDRRLTADRSRADAIAGNLHLQEMATGSQAFTADWSTGPAISEGSSHGDPPQVVLIMIDSPPGELPSTHRPGQEPHGEQSPAQPEMEPTDAAAQSAQSGDSQLETPPARCRHYAGLDAKRSCRPYRRLWTSLTRRQRRHIQLQR